MILNGPFQLEMKVLATDGIQEAVVTFTLGPGVIPTVEKVKQALAATEAEIKDRIGDDWRLATKREFFDFLVYEKTGSNEKFAMGGTADFEPFE